MVDHTVTRITPLSILSSVEWQQQAVAQYPEHFPNFNLHGHPHGNAHAQFTPQTNPSSSARDDDSTAPAVAYRSPGNVPSGHANPHMPDNQPPWHVSVDQSPAHTITPHFQPHFHTAVSQNPGFVHHSASHFHPHFYAAASQRSGDPLPQFEPNSHSATRNGQSASHSEPRFDAAAKHFPHFEPQLHPSVQWGETEAGKSPGSSSGSGSYRFALVGEAGQGSSPRQSKSREAAAAASRGKQEQASKPEKKQPSYWTKEEHELFLIGLHKFSNRNPDDGTSKHALVGLGPGVAELISAFLGSRTVAQVRSHAQKHFLKQWKEKETK